MFIICAYNMFVFLAKTKECLAYSRKTSLRAWRFLVQVPAQLPAHVRLGNRRKQMKHNELGVQRQSNK